MLRPARAAGEEEEEEEEELSGVVRYPRDATPRHCIRSSAAASMFVLIACRSSLF